MSKRISIAWELLFGAVVAWSVVPLWVVDHPAIQDLPQHLAAIRVLADFGDPALRFEQHFETSLGSTQYLAYYLAAMGLSKVVGVKLANLFLVTLALCGIPYAMRALLRALGRDERLALFWLPLTYNAHLILGFFNFIAAIPLALWGLSLAVQLRERPSRRDSIMLAVIAVVAFYTHVVPFAFLALGSFLVLVGADLRASARRLWPLLPAVVAAIVWTQTTPAGQATLTAALSSDEGGPQPQHQPWGVSLRELSSWLTDVLHSEVDDQLLVAWALLLLAVIAFGSRPDPDATMAQTDRDRMRGRLALLAPLAGLAYFVSPASYDWIWPINARFPLLCAVFLIPVLPMPKKLLGWILVAGVIAVSGLSFIEIQRAFIAFDNEEVGDLDAAIETIPPGSRVAGLIWDRGSREVKFSPFIHSVAYYQAERGGAVMFTFADFPQSPFRFREDDRPPRVQPRWEWTPERVDPARDLSWYEYVLVRGGPGRVAQLRDVYEPIHRSRHWSVWRRLE